MYDRNPFIYPRPVSVDTDGDMARTVPAQDGITLRDLAALESFKAMIAGHWSSQHADLITGETFAMRAFAYADAFLAERNRPYDEQQASVRQQRDHILNCRYLIADKWDIGERDVRFVYDRQCQEITRMDALADGAWVTAHGIERSEVQAQMRDISLRLVSLDLDDYELEASDELPDWMRGQS